MTLCALEPRTAVPGASTAAPRIGVLLGQLGTPDAPTPRALRRYLREFLGDPRVIEANRLLWWCILNLIILPSRPRRSAALYRRVWTERGSPLLLTSLEQASALEAALAASGVCAGVEVGMRYGTPAIAEALERLAARGAERILVFPMFPQYAGATTGSLHDGLFAAIEKTRVVPTLRVVPPYPDHPAYIRALAATIREGLAALPWRPEKLLLSFHGIPKRYVDSGDVYRAHTEATASAVAAALGLEAEEWMLSYQSRFGREEWLRPYTDETIEALAAAGVRRIAAACPGFTADCLETIDEIGREARHAFLEAGGEDLRLVPCLNAHPAWIAAMAEIALKELAGWLPAGAVATAPGAKEPSP